jgi:hypothetical protein
MISSTCGACLEVVLKLELGATHFSSSRAKLILDRTSLTLYELYRIFFVQISTLPPIMYQKLTEYGSSCMQNNQLLTITLLPHQFWEINIMLLSEGATCHAEVG